MKQNNIIFIISFLLTILFSLLSFANIIINKNSAIRYELNNQNLVIFPSNPKNSYSIVALVGELKTQQYLKLEKHEDHLMSQIPKNTKFLEIKNETTIEFFTITVEK